MVGMVIAALKPAFNVDSLAHAVLSVGGPLQGLVGGITSRRKRGEIKRFSKVIQERTTAAADGGIRAPA